MTYLIAYILAMTILCAPFALAAIGHFRETRKHH